MRLCVFGAGAVGGFVGGMLARAGAEVSLVARGAHLEAIRAAGLRVETGDGTFAARVPATDRPAGLGVQDVVLLSAKAHALAEAAEAMRPLLGPGTVVVAAQNGIPFWYFHACGGRFEGRTLGTVDPGGGIAAAIGPERVLGCVVNSSNEVRAPGVVRNVGNRRFTLGEPDGAESGRARRVAGLLEAAGLEAPVSAAIRGELWEKMWGNVSFSVMAALTGARLGPLVERPDLRALGIAVMEEVRAVGESLGVVFPGGIEDRVAGTRRVAGHKTSLLQDLERGRPMEVDAIAGAVVEIGRMAGVATPMTDLAYALLRRRAREAGLYRETGFDPLAGAPST